MSNILKLARAYVAMNAAESGADVLIVKMINEIERQTLVIQNLELELERSKTKNASLYNLLALINKQGGLDYNTHDRITTAISITPT